MPRTHITTLTADISPLSSLLASGLIYELNNKVNIMPAKGNTGSPCESPTVNC